MPPKKSKQLSEAEFQRVLGRVRADIDWLQISEKVFRGVTDNLGQHEKLRLWFPVFFGVFCSAMQTDLIIRLGRIYDPEANPHGSCTLVRCLRTMRDSPQFFTDAAITARLGEGYREANPGYLSYHRPDLKQIDAAIASIEGSRERLTALRNKLYAHNDLETALSEKRDGFLSSHEEVRELIRLAHEVCNRCSEIWNASLSSPKTIGEDDYKLLFDFLVKGMKTYD
jgi:hypothetical protein